MKLLYSLLYGIWYLLSLLPLCIHYVLSDLIYLMLYKMLGYRKEIVRKNLATSFPEKSEAELKAIERKFYHCLCDYFAESVKTMTISQEQMRRRMVFKGTEVVRYLPRAYFQLGVDYVAAPLGNS